MFQSLSRKKRGRQPGTAKYKTLSDLFSNTDKTSGGCMEWRGPFNGRGYGVIYIEGKTNFTHRAVLLLSGIEIPKGCYICHRCDNPKCCNPAHLFVGTPSDNIRDAQRKGRLPIKKPVVPKVKVELSHGTRSRYSLGCRCRLCRDAVRDYVRNYRARTK